MASRFAADLMTACHSCAVGPEVHMHGHVSRLSRDGHCRGDALRCVCCPLSHLLQVFGWLCKQKHLSGRHVCCQVSSSAWLGEKLQLEQRPF